MSEENQELVERPSGEAVMMVGWVLIVIGVFAAFVMGGTSNPQTFMLALAVAQIGLSLGILLVPLGYLVRAVYFLPGREVTKAELSGIAVHQESERTGCEWCGQSVLAPNKPCSEIGHERLIEIAGDVTNSKCQVQLVEHGYLEAVDD